MSINLCDVILSEYADDSLANSYNKNRFEAADVAAVVQLG